MCLELCAIKTLYKYKATDSMTIAKFLLSNIWVTSNTKHSPNTVSAKDR